MDKQPEALSLADELIFTGRFAHETEYQAGIRRIIRNETAATELRRLHQANQELVESLEEFIRNPAGDNTEENAIAILAKYKEQA